MEKLEMKNILVAYDLRDTTVPALRFAALLAGRFAAKVTVVYADMSTYPVDLYEAVYAPPTELEVEQLRRDIDTKASAAMPGVPFETRVEAGSPVPMILKAARETNADLIILGTHARTGIRRAFVGSVAEEVMHEATQPVLTVGPDLRFDIRAPKRIICPMTFTDMARESLVYAAQLASAFNAELVAVHVVESVDRMKAAAEESLAKTWIPLEVQQLCTYRTVIAHGDIAERVLSCADDFEADLLVIAAERKTFRNVAVIGPNAERFVRFANCPVLTLPTMPLTREALVPEEPEAVPAP